MTPREFGVNLTNSGNSFPLVTFPVAVLRWAGGGTGPGWFPKFSRSPNCG